MKGMYFPHLGLYDKCKGYDGIQTFFKHTMILVNSIPANKNDFHLN